MTRLARPLLGRECAERHPEAWLRAAGAILLHYDLSGTYDDLQDLAHELRRVAELNGDAYHLAVADFLIGDDRELCEALAVRSRACSEHWTAALATTIAAQYDADADPARGAAQLERAESLVGGFVSEQLDGFQTRTRARIARDLGRLREALGHAERLSVNRSGLMVLSSVLLRAQLGLLMSDREQLDRTATFAERALDGPATAHAISYIHHMLDLVDGCTPRADDWFHSSQPASIGTQWLLCREAIHAGHADLALRTIGSARTRGPFGGAVYAAVTAAATDDVRLWHHALDLSSRHGYQLISTDALEALGSHAATAGPPLLAARLFGAADRARLELGYGWRFSAEHESAASARRHLDELLGERFEAAVGEGADLSIPAAAEYARRARGRRSRPRHGWPALTPTELQVVQLVAEGLTNPQIAERLLVGRATVKTHLEHVFHKLTVRSRAEVAAEYARRSSGDVPA